MAAGLIRAGHRSHPPGTARMLGAGTEKRAGRALTYVSRSLCTLDSDLCGPAREEYTSALVQSERWVLER